MSRPSDGMTLEELREEFDWISEFQGRMAERIRGNQDVHNLVDYVNQLEAENAELHELTSRLEEQEQTIEYMRAENIDWEDRYRALSAKNDELRKKLEQLRDGYGSMSREHSQTITELSDAHIEIDRLKAEADRLREELAKARDPQRIGGQADPSSFVYAIEQLREFRWQHATNDEDAIPYINNVAAAHERENAKLREQMGRLVTLLRNDCDIDASWDGLRGFWSIGLTEDGCLMRDRACKAEAENEKLRELVADMWRELAVACAEQVTSHETLRKVSDRMRELGVEV